MSNPAWPTVKLPSPMLSFVPWSRRPAIGEPAALLARLAQGDTQALAALYRREAGAVYRYALALCGNPAWAAEATQDAFVALAVRPGACDPSRGALGAWLAGVARHTLAARWREARREAPWPDNGGEELDGDADSRPGEDTAADLHAASPEALRAQAQGSAAIWDALRRLPPAFREAVVLVDLQERPYAEAAAIAGLALNTLRTRVHRGRLKLAALLGAHPGRAG